jgi:hypothetical protein
VHGSWLGGCFHAPFEQSGLDAGDAADAPAVLGDDEGRFFGAGGAEPWHVGVEEHFHSFSSSFDGMIMELFMPCLRELRAERLAFVAFWAGGGRAFC